MHKVLNVAFGVISGLIMYVALSGGTGAATLGIMIMFVSYVALDFSTDGNE